MYRIVIEPKLHGIDLAISREGMLRRRLAKQYPCAAHVGHPAGRVRLTAEMGIRIIDAAVVLFLIRIIG